MRIRRLNSFHNGIILIVSRLKSDTKVRIFSDSAKLILQHAFNHLYIIGIHIYIPFAPDDMRCTTDGYGTVNYALILL